jgi:hypothetical protein
MLAGAGEIAKLALTAGKVVVDQPLLGETLESFEQKDSGAVDRVGEAKGVSPIDPTHDIFRVRRPEAFGDRLHLRPLFFGAVDFHEERETLDAELRLAWQVHKLAHGVIGHSEFEITLRRHQSHFVLVVDHGFSSYQKKSTRFDGTLILKNKERI